MSARSVTIFKCDCGQRWSVESDASDTYRSGLAHAARLAREEAASQPHEIGDDGTKLYPPESAGAALALLALAARLEGM